MDIRDHIENARKMVSAARGDSGKYKEEILDGIEGHIDKIERDLKEHDSQKWVVVADANTGFQEIANVHIVTADSEAEAIETAKESQVSYGRFKAYKVGEQPEYGDSWAYYR